MKKFTNKSKSQCAITFADDEVQYLRRGQSFTSDKEIKKIRGDVLVEDVSSSDERTSKKSSK